MIPRNYNNDRLHDFQQDFIPERRKHDSSRDWRELVGDAFRDYLEESYGAPLSDYGDRETDREEDELDDGDNKQSQLEDWLDG